MFFELLPFINDIKGFINDCFIRFFLHDYVYFSMLNAMLAWRSQPACWPVDRSMLIETPNGVHLTDLFPGIFVCCFAKRERCCPDSGITDDEWREDKLRLLLNVTRLRLRSISTTRFFEVNARHASRKSVLIMPCNKKMNKPWNEQVMVKR